MAEKIFNDKKANLERAAIFKHDSCLELVEKLKFLVDNPQTGYIDINFININILMKLISIYP